MRDDLIASLHRQGVEFFGLSPFQQILLTTDGTVTEMLEAWAGENMQVTKLAHAMQPLVKANDDLAAAAGERELTRTILLRGEDSGRCFLFARSHILVDRLDTRVRDGLLESSEPLGRLLLRFRIETFKEIIASGLRPAAEAGEHFGMHADTPLIYRTYRMTSGGKPVMLISEAFPRAFFGGWQSHRA
jgi:chorismate-pyruvate lyase